MDGVRTMCSDRLCDFVHTRVSPGREVWHVELKGVPKGKFSSWAALTSLSGCGAPVCSSMYTMGIGTIGEYGPVYA